MRVLFFDTFSGISGDMTVGALCDLGVPPSTFEWELSKLELGDWHVHFERKTRQNVEGVKFGVHSGAVHTHDQDEPADEHGQVHAHAHAHSHEHGCEHGHQDGHEHTHEHEHEHSHEHSHDNHAEAHEHGRAYLEIRALIERSDLSEFVKKHALSIFHRVAVAEAKIHGATVESIGFHEVGALDSIADIVLACVGLEALGVEKVFVGALSDGRGWVDCAHGRFPIPSLATLEILRGVAPVGQLDEPFEFITPTGAAIVAEFGAGFGVMPRMRIEKIGYGLGTRQLPGRPNALRAVLGELADDETPAAGPTAGYETDTITQIETNLDDLSPELTGAVLEKLFAAGALDASITPAQMKKNRPGVVLTVLCEPGAVGRIADLLFAETSAFGLRLAQKQRLKLSRHFETVETLHGAIRIKLGTHAGKVVQAAPEFEDCRAAAERAGVPLRVVFSDAQLAYQRHLAPADA